MVVATRTQKRTRAMMICAISSSYISSSRASKLGRCHLHGVATAMMTMVAPRNVGLSAREKKKNS